VNLRIPDGHLMELRFPTRESWAATQRTDDLHEVIRMGQYGYARRVDAFLRILAINKEFGLPEHCPVYQSGLPTAKYRGFAEWAGGRSGRWLRYVDELAGAGRTFDDLLVEHGLTRDDVPRSATLDRFVPADEFEYYAIYPTAERTSPVGGLMCDQVTLGPPRTVLFNQVEQRWEVDRSAAAKFLFDDRKQEQTRRIIRLHAERIARDEFGTRLPGEAELGQLIADATTAG
jgi:hypothetical protein